MGQVRIPAPKSVQRRREKHIAEQYLRGLKGTNELI